MTEFICSFLKQSGDLLNILGMVGIAFLTILIPIAVAIFSEKEKDSEVLDRNVILDHVVSARYFLLYLALVYVPILLWEVSSYSIRFLELVLWGIGIYLIAGVLLRSYRWMKGDKFPLRLEYLRNLKDPKDSEESWRSVWQSPNTNAQNELEFFKIFSASIDKLMNDDEQRS